MTPPAKMPQARPSSGFARRGERKRAAAIIETFRRHGVRAGTANLFQVLSTALKSAVMVMNQR